MQTLRLKPMNQYMKWKQLLAILLIVTCSQTVQAQEKKLAVVSHVEIDKYLGLWYEVARKPFYFQQDCIKNVTARYTLNENGNVIVDNRCIEEDQQEKRSVGEAFVVNAPYNSKLKVSFIPEAIRWLPFGRGDYWILKLDKDYRMVLIGEPSRKYLWILAREPKPDPELVDAYLKYASTLGYQLQDVIFTQQSHP